MLFLLASVGMTHILVDSHLLENFRESFSPEGKRANPLIYKMISCYQCSGFWCGAFCGFANFSPSELNGLFSIFSNLTSLAYVLFLSGCASSICSVLMVNILNYLETQSVIEVKESDGEI